MTAADHASWFAFVNEAIDLVNAGRLKEALASLRRLLPSIEAALGPDARELIDPLGVISEAHRRLGNLADSYTVMLRAMTICEKHHGEEGMATCNIRSNLGERLSTIRRGAPLTNIVQLFPAFLRVL